MNTLLFALVIVFIAFLSLIINHGTTLLELHSSMQKAKTLCEENGEAALYSKVSTNIYLYLAIPFVAIFVGMLLACR